MNTDNKHFRTLVFVDGFSASPSYRLALTVSTKFRTTHILTSLLQV